ncbi:RNA polymerase subunit sigma-70, partial [Parabacteroides sp. 20_3]
AIQNECLNYLRSTGTPYLISHN